VVTHLRQGRRREPNNRKQSVREDLTSAGVPCVNTSQAICRKKVHQWQATADCTSGLTPRSRSDDLSG
jgi:hypothetical protein